MHMGFSPCESRLHAAIAKVPAPYNSGVVADEPAGREEGVDAAAGEGCRATLHKIPTLESSVPIANPKRGGAAPPLTTTYKLSRRPSTNEGGRRVRPCKAGQRRRGRWTPSEKDPCRLLTNCCRSRPRGGETRGETGTGQQQQRATVSPPARGMHHHRYVSAYIEWQAVIRRLPGPISRGKGLLLRPGG